LFPLLRKHKQQPAKHRIAFPTSKNSVVRP
jgi:hypothetical protein